MAEVRSKQMGTTMNDPVMTRDFVIGISGTVGESFSIDFNSAGRLNVIAKYAGVSDVPLCLPIDLKQFGDNGIRIVEYLWKDSVPYMIIEDIKTGQRAELVNCFPIGYETSESINNSNNIKVEYLPLEEE
jgi:hypothetical protein